MFETGNPAISPDARATKSVCTGSSIPATPVTNWDFASDWQPELSDVTAGGSVPRRWPETFYGLSCHSGYGHSGRHES